MTSADLLDKPIHELATMSDEQLAAYVSTLIPPSRAPYTGRQTDDSLQVIMPTMQRKVNKLERDNALLMQLLRQAQK